MAKYHHKTAVQEISLLPEALCELPFKSTQLEVASVSKSASSGSSLQNGPSGHERQAAWSLAGFDAATPGQTPPTALWVIGPSAVGKSTLAPRIAPDFGIPLRPPAEAWSEAGVNGSAAAESANETPSSEQATGGGHGAVMMDAVVVDGEHFRATWAEYRLRASSSDWAAAYPLVKRAVNCAKKELLLAASERRKHLLIPHTCLDLPECIAVAASLQAKGYTNHVLAVCAPLEEVARRGQVREQFDGKRYAPSEFGRSLAAFGPMIEACNGRYLVVLVSDQGELAKVSRPFQREELCAGTCGSLPSLPSVLAELAAAAEQPDAPRPSAE